MLCLNVETYEVANNYIVGIPCSKNRVTYAGVSVLVSDVGLGSMWVGSPWCGYLALMIMSGRMALSSGEGERVKGTLSCFDGLVKNHSLSVDGECTGRMFDGSF